MQLGDVIDTYADAQDFDKDINFKPSTTINEGVVKFIKWYKDYYNI